MTADERELLMTLAALVNAMLPVNQRDDGLVGYRNHRGTGARDLDSIRKKIETLMHRLAREDAGRAAP